MMFHDVGVMVGVRQKCSRRAELLYLLFSHNYVVKLNNTILDNPDQSGPTAVHNYRVTLTHHIWGLF